MALSNKVIRYFITGESVRWQISILLTIIAVFLWAHSILFARLEIGYLGLIHGLQVTFFIALALLTIASAILWVSKEKHGKLLLLQLLILVSAIWLIPEVTGGSPPAIVNSYWYVGCSEAVFREGHLFPYSLAFHNWPGLFILTAEVMQIAGLEELTQPVLSICPFLLQLLLLLPLYVFLKNLLGEERSNYCWAGLWLFCLASWLGIGYGARGMALFLSFTLLAVITSPPLWKGEAKPVAYYAIAAIVFAGIATTHFLTMLFMICILGVVSLVKFSKRLGIVTGICVVLLVGSMLGPAAPFCLPNIVGLSLVSQAPEVGEGPGPPGVIGFDPERLIETEIVARAGGSDSHIAVAQTRLLLSGIFALMGLVGVILFCRNRRNLKLAVPILAIVLAPFLLVFIAPVWRGYTGELHSFFYLFGLPPMAFFAVKLLDKKIVAFVLCMVLLCAIPLHVVAHYGNQAIDYFSPAQSAELDFFHNNTTGGYVTGSNPSGWKQNAESYRHIGFSKLQWRDGTLTADVALSEDWPHYVGINRYDRGWYEFLASDPRFFEETEQLLNSSSECNLIYDSQESQLWVRDRRR